MVQKLVAANQFTITDTNDGIAASLTSEAITLAANASGNVASFVGASAVMTVRIGQYDDSANWTYFVSAIGSGISYYGTGDIIARTAIGAVGGVLAGGAIQIATLSADSSYVDITASKLGFVSMTKRINVAKSRNGASARTVKLGASPALAFLTPSGSSTPAPASIMLTATAQGLASPVYAWQIDGVNQAGANTASFSVSSFTAGSAKTVKVIATDAGGSVEDSLTIASVRDGDVGADGITYTIAVESTNGSIFRVGQSVTTYLIAHVFRNGVEVTSETPASQFQWRRVSYYPRAAPNDDATWNAAYATGYKQITITTAAVEERATYHCDLLLP